MSDLNLVVLTGHLGKDPEVRYTPSGAAVCNFSIATGEKWTDKQGQKQERTEWHRIVAWNKTGEFCGQYLAKGRHVRILGKLQTRKWDKDGQTHYSTEIVAKEVECLDSGKGKAEAKQTVADPITAGIDVEPPPSTDGDIPF